MTSKKKLKRKIKALKKIAAWQPANRPGSDGMTTVERELLKVRNKS